MTVLASVVCAWTGTSFAGGQPLRQNLLQNAGFESDQTRVWFGLGMSGRSRSAVGGDGFALRIDLDETFDRGVSQKIPVMGGGTYEISTRVRAEWSFRRGTCKAEVRWFDEVGLMLRTDVLGELQGEDFWPERLPLDLVLGPRVDERWGPFVWVAPSQATEATLVHFCDVGRGTMFFDDDEIRLVVDPRPPSEEEPLAAVQGGRWTDPATWGGRVPGASNAVEIGPGIEVLFDRADDGDASTDAARVTIRGGSLRFSRERSTRLDLEGSLLVLGGGELDMGRPDDPIPPEIEATLGFNVFSDRFFSSNEPRSPFFQPGPMPDSMPDFHPEDTGLWAMGSGVRVHLHGAPKAFVWTHLAADVAVGDRSITLAEVPKGWRVGDTVLVTPTDRRFDEGELRRIARIDGRRLELDAPLEHAHGGSVFAVDTASGRQRRLPKADPGLLRRGERLVSLRGEVALLTQNVRVVSNRVREGDPHHRAHCAFMMGAAVDLRFAEIRDLGPRAMMGRYPLHFHQAASSTEGSRLDSLSIWSSTPSPGNKWVVIHGTNGIRLENSVGYHAQGAGFYLESADERANVLRRNLGVRVEAQEEVVDPALARRFGHVPESAAVFWVREGNVFEENVAVAAGPGETAGFWITPNVSAGNGTPLPATVFRANVAHSGATGIYLSGGSAFTSRLEGSLLFRNQVGVQSIGAPVNVESTGAVLYGNAVDFMRPMPGIWKDFARLEDADPIERADWTLVDHYRDLDTHRFTFMDVEGTTAQGNRNYYEGDFGDYDGDGLVDRALVSRWGLLRNLGAAFFETVAGVAGVRQTARNNLSGMVFKEDGGEGHHELGDDAIQLVDIDGDDDYDLVVGGNGEVFHFQRNRAGRFSLERPDFFASAQVIVATDVEGDGDVDLAVGYDLGSDFNLLINDGQGRFHPSDAAWVKALKSKQIGAIASGDLDGDGDLDLVLASDVDDDVKFAMNEGGQSYAIHSLKLLRTLADPLAAPKVNGFDQGMNLGDLDDDGDLDVFWAVTGLERGGSHERVNSVILINDGRGGFAEESHLRFDVGDYHGPRLVGGNGKLVDLDLDGDLDAAIFEKNGAGRPSLDHKLSIFLNDGSGHFRFDPVRSFTFAGPMQGDIGAEVDVADLDGDGTYDLWLGLGGEDVRILLNTARARDGEPADVPRDFEIESVSPDGVVLAWDPPPFATNARHYRVLRALAPGLAPGDRPLLKNVGRPHQDEGLAAPVTRHSSGASLGDPDVEIDPATGRIRLRDRSARPGIAYAYSVVHVGAENVASRPTDERIARVPGAERAPDREPPALVIGSPRPDEWRRTPEIVVQMADGGAGIDPSSLRIAFDRPLGSGAVATGGRPSGVDLVDLGWQVTPSVFRAVLPNELALSPGPVRLTVQVADREGHVAERTVAFEVEPPVLGIRHDTPPEPEIEMTPSLDGRRIELSAAASRDAEGGVTRFRWWLPDGRTAVGRRVSLDAADAAGEEVTLVVWDDMGGMARSVRTLPR